MATFTDNFNRADSTNLGSGWVEVSGDWSIVSNQLSPGSAGGTIILRCATAMDTNDNYAQITITATNALSHGIWCRGNSNITQGYLWRNDGTSWNLFSVVGGSFTSIGSFAGAAAVNDVAKIQAVGSTIKGFVNGIERVSVTNTAVTTGTAVGVRAESSSTLRFDDFSAGDVSTTTNLSLTPASGVDTAQAVSGTKSAALGVPASTETAQALTGVKTALLGTASSTETSQPFTGTKSSPIATAASPETAQSLTGIKTVPIGLAFTVDTSDSVGAVKSSLLGTSISVDASSSLSGTKTAALQVAAAIENAQPPSSSNLPSLGTTQETEQAQAVTGTKTHLLGIAYEVDSAHPVIAAGNLTTSPERTCTVPPGQRRISVPVDNRTLIVPVHNRTLTVER